ncbi:hypothetical protein C2845_PM17G08310 [Panicum miliaceum]|uniref:Uncharacterized protein n=1 Tax=Panicum miliaceum TaxID=4540 RepID=A0A3L6Q322_PANMI|nr:hypothetical protein C2845_PM17G08310 [Panicum miliaceum]
MGRAVAWGAHQDAVRRGACVRWHWWSAASCKVVDGDVQVAASSEPSSKAHGEGRRARAATGRSCGPVPARTACRSPMSCLMAEECTKTASPLLAWKIQDRANDVQEQR